MHPADKVLKASSPTRPQSQRGNITIGHTQIRVKGNAVDVSSVQIDGRILVTTGKWLRIATIQDEELVEGEVVVDPEAFVSRLQASGFEADILTFAQKLQDIVPKYKYHVEWDSLAVIPINSYADWLEKRAASDVRVAVKKAAKLGVLVKQAELDDGFVEGIVQINNESKYRQGKPFWHYGRDFDTVKQMNSTYLERSTLIGAYYKDELIGYIRMIQVGKVAMTLQVISMMKYFNKKPTNALIAKAVEICAQRGNSHLVYGNYVYKDPKSSLTEFKRRNGFEEVLVPRYYIPLTLKGRVALGMKLHKGIVDILPLEVWKVLSRLRAHALKYRTAHLD